MAPRRRLLLWGMLALTVSVAIWVGSCDDGGLTKKNSRQMRPAPVATPSPVAGAGSAPVELTLAGLVRKPYATASADLFPDRSWLPPSTAQPEGPAEPPPLPFTYIGKLRENGGTVVFLLYQERTIAVHQGDIIDRTYRVQKIAPQSIVMIYLPLKQQQSLNLGSAN